MCCAFLETFWRFYEPTHSCKQRNVVITLRYVIDATSPSLVSRKLMTSYTVATLHSYQCKSNKAEVFWLMLSVLMYFWQEKIHFVQKLCNIKPRNRGRGKLEQKMEPGHIGVTGAAYPAPPPSSLHHPHTFQQPPPAYQPVPYPQINQVAPVRNNFRRKKRKDGK